MLKFKVDEKKREKLYQWASIILFGAIGSMFIGKEIEDIAFVRVSAIYIMCILSILIYKSIYKKELAVPTVNKFIFTLISFSVISLIMLPKESNLVDSIIVALSTIISCSLVLWSIVKIIDIVLKSIRKFK